MEYTCYVCNDAVSNGVNLATAVAPASKTGLAEKISQVIGEQFVVIITVNDVVCKRCVALLSHMDRLQNELALVKKVVLHHTKNKYHTVRSNNLLSQPQPQPQPSSSLEKSNEVNEVAEEPLTESKENKRVPSPLPPPSLSLDELSLLNNIADLVVPSSSAIKPKDTMSSNRTRELSYNKTKPQQQQQLLNANNSTGTNRVKLYKCGFCSYQSRELLEVRTHMKQHVKANNNELISMSNVRPPRPKRHLFKCQLCSLSFEEKIKCLEHISIHHRENKRLLQDGNVSSNTVKQKQFADDVEMADGLSAAQINLNCTNDSSSFADSMLQYGTGTGIGIPAQNHVDNNSAFVIHKRPLSTSSDIGREPAKKDVHAIDIEAMIASLSSDGLIDPS